MGLGDGQAPLQADNRAALTLTLTLALTLTLTLTLTRYVGPALHQGGSTVLLGDAIHTVKPYFGLGV